MSARESDTRRRVEQYVQRQRAYVPIYTSERVVDQCSGTPPRSDAFGFGTPVLRPRAPVESTSNVVPSTSQVHEIESPQDTTPARPRQKRQQDRDSDDERVARLADRRARKRKKRAIVNPPQDTVPTENSKPSKRGGKVKKAAALALLYGFSATNVTKDRLTLKPSLSLGVFSKGKASAKKKVTAATKFCEAEFLNKTKEQAADHSKIDDTDSSRPQDTKMTRNKPSSTPPVAESEVWDIELQSKLPSTVRDVSSEPGANESAPVVLDPRGAQWSASLDIAAEHCDDSNRNRARSLSFIHPSEVLTKSDLRDDSGRCIPHTEDTPSIHPSHSVSQVGHGTTEAQPPEPRQATSKYFTTLTPVSVEGHATIPTVPTSRSDDGFDVCDHRVPDQDVQYSMSHEQRMISPIHSVSSAAQPMRGWYDVAPLVFSSDCASSDDCYADAHVRSEPHGVLGGGCFTPSVMEHDVHEYYPQQGALYSMLPELGGGDVGMEYFEDEDDFETGEWSHDDAAFGDGEEEGVPPFLEGRTLLLKWTRVVGAIGTGSGRDGRCESAA